MANIKLPSQKDAVQLQQQQLMHHQVHLNTISTLTSLYQAIPDKSSSFGITLESALTNLIAAFLPASTTSPDPEKDTDKSYLVTN